MFSVLENERGVTIVELLGALALMSIVILLISSVHLFGQKQFVNQSEDIENMSNVRLVIATISKDLRSADPTQLSSPNSQTLIINDKEYAFSNSLKQMLQNNVKLANNIDKFEVKLEENDTKINLEVESVKDQHGNTASLSTVIYIRE
ncbi:hypothetical protein NC661_02085 [Aquibacillus koreensis]|uniref:Prepilin-type N-terminal cleavage/methylation domain-containing protein n=1 Tax=Aquibacillus koreensis TaxID=279446 RepID=A0A9X4AGL1_9BACI|nr:hypothetical protein [Aquibacillus koreensis]MCT2537942.1 hypothetical protein [Aquibacillus koreensis]MDC3419167.1 hypothetical protein [Aquibacillus koreensis]